ncbi:MAG TPA: hypothetical protein VJN90_02810 [Candidatus Acidoferrales bacterium]|nr:hypothetical protein [Candidatus Acidoferrales bacterium]
MPQTKTEKSARAARDREFENLLQAASRRLTLPQLKYKNADREQLKTLVFTG